MEKNTNWMASTDCIIILQKILFECIWISSFNYFDAHPVQSLNRFVYGPMFLVIVQEIESDKKKNVNSSKINLQLNKC